MVSFTDLDSIRHVGNLEVEVRLLIGEENEPELKAQAGKIINLEIITLIGGIVIAQRSFETPV